MKSVGQLSHVCSQIVLKCKKLARIGRPDIYDQWIRLHDRLRNGPKPVTNAWIDWFHTFITHVNTDNIVMWEILPNNADWDCFKTLTSREILRTQNLLRVEHCAFLEVIHCSDKLDVQETNFSFTQFNRIRNHFFGCRIEVRWHSRSRCRILETRIRTEKNGETRCWINVKFVLHLTRFTNASNLREWSMIWIMLISATW